MSLPGEIRVVQDAAALTDTLERILFQAISEAVEQRGQAGVLLSGGQTPRLAYSLMALRRKASPSVRRTRYFVGDERLVPVADPESNAGMITAALLDPLHVPHDLRHLPDGGADPGEQARTLTAALSRLPVDLSEEPVFDIVLLGMGADGHVASLFPDTAALGVTLPAYVVNHVPALGASRLTVTFPVINAARLVVIACVGGRKTSVLKEVASRGHKAPVYPVERVRPSNLIWLLDEEAAP